MFPAGKLKFHFTGYIDIEEGDDDLDVIVLVDRSITIDSDSESHCAPTEIDVETQHYQLTQHSRTDDGMDTLGIMFDLGRPAHDEHGALNIISYVARPPMHALALARAVLGVSVIVS